MADIILIVTLVLAALAVCQYLVVCAASERWLTLDEWWGRTRCPHQHGRLLAIEFDGTAVYECVACGKPIRKPL